MLSQVGEIETRINLLTKADTKYRVEFFGADSCGPNGTGEAETFIAAETVETNGSGAVLEAFSAWQEAWPAATSSPRP